MTKDTAKAKATAAADEHESDYEPGKQGVTAEALAPTPVSATDAPAEPDTKADEEPRSAFLPEEKKEQHLDLPHVKRGHKLVVYLGQADVVRHGEYTFRPGQPASVPSEVAEELLTLPFETFEAIDKE